MRQELQVQGGSQVVRVGHEHVLHPLTCRRRGEHAVVRRIDHRGRGTEPMVQRTDGGVRGSGFGIGFG